MIESTLNLKSSYQYLYKCTQRIKSYTSVNLITNVLDLNAKNLYQNNTEVQFSMNSKKSNIEFLVTENLYLPNYLQAYLKYTNIEFCNLIEPNQFVDAYTTLGYFEVITLHSLEIVKIKVKSTTKKQILLISNDDCLTIKKKNGGK